MTTIAFALDFQLSPAVQEEVDTLAEGFNYQASYEIGRVDLHVREGLSQAVDRLDLSGLLLLDAPLANEQREYDLDTAMAPAIQEEIFQWEFSRTEPPFFEFLRAFHAIANRRSQSYYVFFIEEWSRDESIRYEQGTVDDLIDCLRRPANWMLRLWSPATGRTQDSDELALMFHVENPE